MTRLVPRCFLIVVLVVGVMGTLACSKDSSLKSNFSTVAIVENTITKASSKEPYTGTVIARDKEIIPLARAVLGELYQHGAGVDPTGLVLVLPVENGAASGRATLHVDLNAPVLHPEVARRSKLELTVARTRSGTIKFAEATFANGKLDGTATVFGPDGKQLAEVPFKQHRLHGTAIEQFPGTAQRSRELTFVDGVQTGPQRWYHANGKLQRQATMVAGEIDGTLEEHYATGAAHKKASYERSKPIGTHTTWYPSGQKASELVFENGELVRESRWYSNGADKSLPPNGVVEEFHASGTLHTRTTYVDGVKQGAYEMLYADGKPWKRGTYEANQLHGPYKEWWKTGAIALEATYVNGVLDGDFRRLYANGKPHETVRYERGLKVGPYRKFWKNGKPAHVYAYKANKLDGKYEQFYDNGAKWALAEYVDGKPQGAIQRWFPDGKLGYVMNHAEGRPHGEYKRWWSDGKPRLEAMHVRGVLDGEFKNWLEDGTLYEQATYERGLKIRTTRPEKPQQ